MVLFDSVILNAFIKKDTRAKIDGKGKGKSAKTATTVTLVQTKTVPGTSKAKEDPKTEARKAGDGAIEDDTQKTESKLSLLFRNNFLSFKTHYLNW